VKKNVRGPYATPVIFSSREDLCLDDRLDDRLQGVFYVGELALVLAVSKRYGTILVFSGEQLGWIAKQYVVIVT